MAESGIETLSLPGMLSLLDDEATVLNQMHEKISLELHRLQVEEEMFMRTLEKLELSKRSSSKNGKKHRAVDADQELAEALREVLTENRNNGKLDQRDKPSGPSVL